MARLIYFVLIQLNLSRRYWSAAIGNWKADLVDRASRPFGHALVCLAILLGGASCYAQPGSTLFPPPGAPVPGVPVPGVPVPGVPVPGAPTVSPPYSNTANGSGGGPVFVPPRNAYVNPPAANGIPFTPPPQGSQQMVAIPATSWMPSPSIFEAAETIARVGDQYVFQGELMGDANLMLAPFIARLGPEELEQNRIQIEAERNRLLAQLQQSAIDRKMMFVAFLQGIPADKLEEAMGNIEEKVAEAFTENLFKMLENILEAEEEELGKFARADNQLFRLALIMKQRNLTSLGQLAGVLRDYGSSLDTQRQMYAERVLGQQKMRDSIEIEPEITHTEMLAHYEQNQDEFQVAARARWQQITVRYDRHLRRTDAGDEIAALGNELALGGTPFWAVAQRSSDGPNADNGGYFDWTVWGDLSVSQPVSDAVFSLPANELSDIIQDAVGLHIIRVLEREDTHLIRFLEAQPDIKKKLKSQKRSKSINDYIARLKDQIPVWKEDTLQR